MDTTQDRTRWRRRITAAAFLVGLAAVVWLAFQVSIQLFDNQTYDDQLADCDDCGVVAWLEALPVIGVGVALYVAVWVLGRWLSRRRRRTGNVTG